MGCIRLDETVVGAKVHGDKFGYKMDFSLELQLVEAIDEVILTLSLK
jgi:hypothetical protein